MRSTRRRALIATVAAATAVLVPSVATTADRPSPGALRAKLADAIADEQRALALIAKKPPRTRAAGLAVNQSGTRLRELVMSGGLPNAAAGSLNQAANSDHSATIQLARDPAPGDDHLKQARYLLQDALGHKAVAMALLSRPAAPRAGPQCADKSDNDGDGTVDGRHDSGCASAKDTTESTAMTCSLGYTSGTPVSAVQGTCSGPFAKVELTAPAGTAFVTDSTAVVQNARACRYVDERKLECAMGDGVANPRHVVSARFRLTRPSAAGPRVVIRDFGRRGRAWPARTRVPYLRFRLTYTHEGLSHVCVSLEGSSGALVRLRLEGPNGQAAAGTLQLQKKATPTATGGFSFRILSFGSYRVIVVLTVGGKSVTQTQTIEVTGAPGDPRCSASGAPPP